MCFFHCGEGATRLSKCALGVAIGAVKGFWLLVLAWSAWLTGYGATMVDHISQSFPNYGPTLGGGLMGGLFGFICGFILGFLVAWIYNLCLRCCQKRELEKKM